PRLALECLFELLVVDERLLEGHRAAEALVGRLVDGAHTALPKLADDQVPVLQKRVGGEHGGLQRSSVPPATPGVNSARILTTTGGASNIGHDPSSPARL